MKLKRMLIVLLVAVMVLSNATGILGITKVKEAEAVAPCTRTDLHHTSLCGASYTGRQTWSVSVATYYTVKITATRKAAMDENNKWYQQITWKLNISGFSSGGTNRFYGNGKLQMSAGGFTSTGPAVTVGTDAATGRNMCVTSITVPDGVMSALGAALRTSSSATETVGRCPNPSSTTGNVYHQHNAVGSDSYYYYWDSKNPTSQGTMGGYTIAAFTLTYDGNKPNVNAADVTNVPEAANVERDTETVISATIPVCEGYVFTGWNTNADGTGTAYSPGASISMTEDVTLYAQWTPGICSLTYVENLSDPLGLTGMPSPNPQTATTETNVTVSTNVPTSTNYWFLGWNTVANPTTENPGTVYAAGTIWRNDSLAFSIFCLRCLPISDTLQEKGEIGMASISEYSSEDLHEYAAAFTSDAMEDCDNEDYASAIQNLECSIAALTELSKRLPADYEPYLYGAWDTMCLVYYNNLRDVSRARFCETKALEIAKRCKARRFTKVVADDVSLFEDRLRNDL